MDFSVFSVQSCSGRLGAGGYSPPASREDGQIRRLWFLSVPGHTWLLGFLAVSTEVNTGSCCQ